MQLIRLGKRRAWVRSFVAVTFSGVWSECANVHLEGSDAAARNQCKLQGVVKPEDRSGSGPMKSEE